MEYGSAEDQPPGDYNDSFASTGDVALDKLKIPPHSIEAEQSVIGGLMLSPETWDSISDTLVEGDFYRREHRLIFRTMSSLVEIQSPLDVITLSEALQSRAELDNVGGLSYLGELATNTPSIANIKAYADIIRERSTLRQLIGAATDTAEDCFYPEGREAGELLSDAEQRISNIAEGRPKIGGPQDANSLLKSTIEKIDELFNTDGSLTGLTTGFKDIDEQTSGLQNSDLIIVAARPSMGKTALA
ncbi:MAG: replicative DNA helicase, partial [Flavobacteriales bacterium]